MIYFDRTSLTFSRDSRSRGFHFIGDPQVRSFEVRRSNSKYCEGVKTAIDYCIAHQLQNAVIGKTFDWTAFFVHLKTGQDRWSIENCEEQFSHESYPIIARAELTVMPSMQIRRGFDTSIKIKIAVNGRLTFSTMRLTWDDKASIFVYAESKPKDTITLTESTIARS